MLRWVHFACSFPQRVKTEVATKLGEFLQAYIVGRTDVKARTTSNLDQARKNLVAFFGASKLLAEINAGDAEDFSRWLRNRKVKPLADNTARRLCGRAKQFFSYALRKRLITTDPFSDLRGVTVKGNPERLYLVSREESQQVLDACPNAQWRLLFALARFGGLRTPSESLALRWSDVDWEHNRLRVPCPKLEHLEGKGERIIPLFAELRPHLEAAFHEAAEGSEFIITGYRDAEQNLRTQLFRIIRKAGLTPWGKVWQNLRATRETELAAIHPLHVVCEWIGNSPKVAAKHYLSVSDADFLKATTSDLSKTPRAAESPPSAAPALQQLAETACSGLHDEQASTEKPRVLHGVSAHCDSSRRKRIPPAGVEPATSALGKLRSIHLSYGGNRPHSKNYRRLL